MSTWSACNGTHFTHNTTQSQPYGVRTHICIILQSNYIALKRNDACSERAFYIIYWTFNCTAYRRVCCIGLGGLWLRAQAQAQAVDLIHRMDLPSDQTNISSLSFPFPLWVCCSNDIKTATMFEKTCRTRKLNRKVNVKIKLTKSFINENMKWFFPSSAHRIKS